MTNIFNLTEQYVKQYDLDNHPWFSFAAKCSQEEFLTSQEGFYYAVKGFPRILAHLASQIDSSKARLLVIENLWEEHGHGNSAVFHTTTYFQYLQSLGFKKEESEIAHQPWVDGWLENVLSKNYSAEQYSLYIAGIEYIYARISQFISQLVSGYILCNEQTHYANHAVLDYEHSKELIETSLLIQQEKNPLLDNTMMEYFTLGISEFLQLYTNMIILTEKEAQLISQEQHAFYYGREDTSVATTFLNTWYESHQKAAHVLTICSGGENAIDLLSMTQQQDNNLNATYNAHHTHGLMNLTLLDINPHQLKLAEKKITCIKNKGDLSDDLSIYNVGKFEKIFTFLKNSLTHDELEAIAHKEVLALAKLKFICDNAFSNRMLEIVFTENATKYSKESFSDHFYQLMVKQIAWYFETKPTCSNIGSIFFDTAPIDYQVHIDPRNAITYYNGDFLSFFNDSKNSENHFDLIDLSNISDWMPFNDMKKIVETAFSRLNKGGAMIGRKLLGDYQWSQLQQSLPYSTITPVIDTTLFYTECVLIKKLDFQFIC